MSSVSLGRVGYWWSEKKSRKFNVHEFANVCQASGLELVKLDLDRPIEEQGPFVAIVHKLIDVILKAEKGDVGMKAVCDAFQKYVDSHPNIVVIDPLPNVMKLLDRNSQYKLVDEVELQEQGDAFIPAFVELTTMDVCENLKKLKAAGVDFPIVCKPSLAHGPPAHQMSLIFHEEGLKDISPPCVAQKFINHNAVLYKVFLIGDKYFMTERPSLKNFTAGDQKTIFFDSHSISKPHSASVLTELDDNDQLTPVVWPAKEKIDRIVQLLHKSLGLNLLGIDVIVDNKSGRHAIIDMNVFPGYDEVDNFFQLLCELIVKKISFKGSDIDQAVSKPILGNCSSTSRMRPGTKFDFESKCALQYIKDEQSKASVPHPLKCFCCPVSDACHYTYAEVKCVHKANCSPQNKMQSLKGNLSAPYNNLVSRHPQDCTQDDSGIETSDSCDEKKKETCYRTTKRQHSRNSSSPCFSVNETG